MQQNHADSTFLHWETNASAYAKRKYTHTKIPRMTATPDNTTFHLTVNVSERAGKLVAINGYF